MPSVVADLARRWDTDPDDARSIVHSNLATLYAATVTAAPEP
jgi:hypothetical protein